LMAEIRTPNLVNDRAGMAGIINPQI